MRDQFELSTTVPHEEPCIQLGEENYSKFSRLEAKVLINQIKRTIGEPPARAHLMIIECPHDFGVYHDVAVVYADDDEESVEYRLKVESGIPSEWDEEAKQLLRENGYPVGKYDGRLR
jgi:hypothetical protein